MSVYYHGGVPGLTVGDRILPPAVTGIARSPMGEREPGTRATRSDRVYLIREPGIAVIWAAMYENGGGVYEAEPEPPVEPDPDWVEPDVSVQASAARVLAVLDADALAAEIFYGRSLADVRKLLPLAKRLMVGGIA